MSIIHRLFPIILINRGLLFNFLRYAALLYKLLTIDFATESAIRFKFKQKPEIRLIFFEELMNSFHSHDAWSKLIIRNKYV